MKLIGNVKNYINLYCRLDGKVCSDRGDCECGECVKCFPSLVSSQLELELLQEFQNLHRSISEYA